MHVHSFHGEYSVKTLLEPSQVCQTHMIFGIDVTPTMLNVWWIFGWGSGPKDMWSERSFPTGKTKGQLSIEGP